MDKKELVNEGFTLIEMMVAVLLAAMILLSLAAIFSMTYSWFKSTFRQNIIQANTLVSFNTLSQDLVKTTYLIVPSTGTILQGPQGSDTLVGCTNYSDVLGGMPDTSVGAKMRAYYYCVDSSGNMQYTWIESATPIACPQSPTSCGAAISGGGQLMQLASGVQRDDTGSDSCNSCGVGSNQPCFFCRPANVSNQVQIHYWISEAQSTTTVKINTTVNTMMTFNGPP